MWEMYSWSSSDDCSRDSSVTSAGAALDYLSGMAVGVLVVGVPVVFTGCVAVDDCWSEDEGWAELGWDGEDGAGVGMDAGSWLVGEAWPSRRARARRRPAMYFFFSSGLLFFQWTLSWTMTTSVWTGLVRSGVLVRWSSASGSSSITVCRDVDFPLPAIPTITSLVRRRLVTPRFISSS